MMWQASELIMALTTAVTALFGAFAMKLAARKRERPSQLAAEIDRLERECCIGPYAELDEEDEEPKKWGLVPDRVWRISEAPRIHTEQGTK